MTSYDFRQTPYRFVAVPPVLDELLDASWRLRAFAVHSGLAETAIVGGRMWQLADLVEYEATKLIRQWRNTVRPCDSCGAWSPAWKVVVEGLGLARVQLCPACAGGAGPPGAI